MTGRSGIILKNALKDHHTCCRITFSVRTRWLRRMARAKHADAGRSRAYAHDHTVSPTMMALARKGDAALVGAGALLGTPILWKPTPPVFSVDTLHGIQTLMARAAAQLPTQNTYDAKKQRAYAYLTATTPSLKQAAPFHAHSFNCAAAVCHSDACVASLRIPGSPFRAFP